MKLKLNNDQLSAIMDREKIDGFEYEFIEQSDWEIEGKIQHCEVIIKHNEKYYAFYPFRSGDYWSGYEVDFFEEDLVEVKGESYTSYRWVQVTAQENSNVPIDLYKTE